MIFFPLLQHKRHDRDKPLLTHRYCHSLNFPNPLFLYTFIPAYFIGLMKNNPLLLLCFLLIILCPLSVYAQSRKFIDRTTDAAMFVNPLAGLIGSLAVGDYQGTKQWVGSGASSIAVTYLLKYSVSKKRPDGSDQHAFPSNHTAVSMMGAAFLQKRYGWKFGLPAYALSAYVGWGRIYAKKHDIWDVLAGAAIGSAAGYLFTRPFSKKHKLTFTPTVTQSGHAGIYFSITF